MQSTADDYSFRPATEADLPLLERWLQQSHVVRWWPDAEYQLHLIRTDLGQPEVNQQIVCCAEIEFAFTQDYVVESTSALAAGLPADTRAIDTFIGRVDHIGRGHGPRYLQCLADRLLNTGARAVIMDPDVSNVAAEKAYLKAGFRNVTTILTADGYVNLMRFDGGITLLPLVG